MELETGIVLIIIQLIFLEGILSIDNAAVLGALVQHLPTNKPMPFPPSLKFLEKPMSHLGAQRDAALKIGLFGAYAGRALMLALASIIISIWWIRVLGAAYLLYLGIKHLAHLYSKHVAEEATGVAIAKEAGFWATVSATIFADLAFSVDNVIAAVALSPKLWVVLLGVGLGMLIMRFAAMLFSRAITWEPALETGAYLLLIAIGTELMLKEFFHLHMEEWMQFVISVSILVLTILFARTPALRSSLIIFRPFMALSAGLIWVVDQITGVLTMPFRRRSLPIEK